MARRYWYQSLQCGRILGTATDGSLVLCGKQHGHGSQCPQPAIELQPIGNQISMSRAKFRELCAERWTA